MSEDEFNRLLSNPARFMHTIVPRGRPNAFFSPPSFWDVGQSFTPFESSNGPMVQPPRSAPAQPIIDIVEDTQDDQQEVPTNGSATKKRIPRKAAAAKKPAKKSKKAVVVSLTEEDEDDDGNGSRRWKDPEVQ